MRLVGLSYICMSIMTLLYILSYRSKQCVSWITKVNSKVIFDSFRIDHCGSDAFPQEKGEGVAV